MPIDFNQDDFKLWYYFDLTGWFSIRIFDFTEIATEKNTFLF